MPKAPLKFEDLSLKPGFKATNGTILHDKGSRLVVAFDGEFKGREFFGIQEIYEEYGVWNPGKGISVPMDKKDEFLKSLAMMLYSMGIIEGGATISTK